MYYLSQVSHLTVQGDSPPPVLLSKSVSTRSKAPEPAPESKEQARPRARMTLRIPDDEVVRPEAAPMTPDGGVSAVGQLRPPSGSIPAAPRVESTPPSRSRLLAVPASASIVGEAVVAEDAAKPPVADAFLVATPGEALDVHGPAAGMVRAPCRTS